MCTVLNHQEAGPKQTTLTLPVINHDKRISFVVTGKHKASLVAKILKEEEGAQSLPASSVRPVNGLLEWILDETSGMVKNIPRNRGNRNNHLIYPLIPIDCLFPPQVLQFIN